MNQTFWVGIYQGLTKKHLDYAVDKIEKFIENAIGEPI